MQRDRSHSRPRDEHDMITEISSADEGGAEGRDGSDEEHGDMPRRPHEPSVSPPQRKLGHRAGRWQKERDELYGPGGLKYKKNKDQSKSSKHSRSGRDRY